MFQPNKDDILNLLFLPNPFGQAADSVRCGYYPDPAVQNGLDPALNPVP
jgi:hypothetical protein